MSLKVFRMSENEYIDNNNLNEWAEENHFKIDNINVCPKAWYLNENKDRVQEMELIISVLYHKKYQRRIKNGQFSTK